MSIKVSAISFFFLAATIFLFTFEQVLVVFLGIDSILKPYRVTVLVGIVFLIMFPVKITSQVKVISLSLAGLYIFGAFIALLWVMVGSGSYERLVNQFVLFFIAYCVYLMVVYNIRNVDDLEKVFFVILFSVFVSSVIWIISNAGIDSYRASGFFRNPNHFAYNLGISILISIFLFIKAFGRWLFIIPLIININISVILLLLSGSRSALLALVIVLLIAFYRYKNIGKYGNLKRILISVLIAVFLFGLINVVVDSQIIPSRLLSRYEMENMAGASGRTDLIRSGVIAAIEYFGLGMGMGQYMEYHQQYIQQVSGYVYRTVLEYDLGLHNEYLVLFVEFGVMPLLLYFFIIYLMWRSVRYFYKNMPQYSMYAIIVEGLLLFDIIFSFSQEMYAFPSHWLVLGICTSLIQLGSNSRIMKSKYEKGGYSG